jgi:hypothetical protein
MTFVSDYRRGFGLDIGFIDTFTHDSELQTITASPLLSTVHNSSQHPLSVFQRAVSSPAVPWQRLLTVEILQLHGLRSPFKSSRTKLTWLFQLSSLYLLCMDRGETPVSKSTSIVARRFVVVEMCLPSRCLEMGLVYLPVSRSSHSNCSTRYNNNNNNNNNSIQFFYLFSCSGSKPKTSQLGQGQTLNKFNRASHHAEKKIHIHIFILWITNN